MSGPGEKEKKSAISWQNGTSSEVGAGAPITARTDPDEFLRAKAAKFLEDEQVQKAPKSTKRSFLVSKGLAEPDVDQLLDKEHALETEDPSRAGQQATNAIEDQDLATQQTRQIHALESAQSASTPPIITYPDFLLHAQKPPPLITAQRLITAAYIISGAAAASFGASKYMVEPMLGSLGSARHSLYESVSTNGDILNEKLEAIVSKRPSEHGYREDRELSGAKSEDLDAARFFTRTIATQTSPQRSRSGSATSDGSVTLPTATATQKTKLSDLRSRLEEIKPSDTSDRSIKESLDELRVSLDALQLSSKSNLWKYAKNTTDDPIMRIKAEIRGVKGVLLNARNFPSSSVK